MLMGLILKVDLYIKPFQMPLVIQMLNTDDLMTFLNDKFGEAIRQIWEFTLG